MSRRRMESGVTLVEMMVSVAVLAILLSIVMTILISTNNAYNAEVVIVDLEQHSRWVMDRFVEDVRASVASTRVINVVGNDVTISMRRNAGYFGGAVQLGNTVTYQTEMFPGEVDDGVDNNGNNLIDERQLVRIEGASRSVISPWVEEGGFVLVDRVTMLDATIRLRNIDGNNNVHQRTMNASVQFRNP